MLSNSPTYNQTLMCHSSLPSFSCASNKSSSTTRKSKAAKAKAIIPTKTGLSCTSEANSATAEDAATMATGGSPRTSSFNGSPPLRIAGSAAAHAKEKPKNPISMAVAMAINQPLCSETDPANPINMPSTMLSMSTARTNPHGIGLTAGAATCSDISGKGLGNGGEAPCGCGGEKGSGDPEYLGAHRRNTARCSAWLWMRRNAAAIICNWASMPGMSDGSTLRHEETWSFKSATAKRSRTAQPGSTGSVLSE
mmetsp:Transcript_93569/g.302845  ORF Transcript_93569/g.302845 Transcript_93569/m.302845 type:complete len:252 (-) Transcript_93569:732-1487(-)